MPLATGVNGFCHSCQPPDRHFKSGFLGELTDKGGFMGLVLLDPATGK